MCCRHRVCRRADRYSAQLCGIWRGIPVAGLDRLPVCNLPDPDQKTGLNRRPAHHAILLRRYRFCFSGSGRRRGVGSRYLHTGSHLAQPGAVAHAGRCRHHCDRVPPDDCPCLQARTCLRTRTVSVSRNRVRNDTQLCGVPRHSRRLEMARHIHHNRIRIICLVA